MTWNATDYQNQCSYVWQHGESLLAQLNPQPGERILDLGCGTGQLSAQIAKCQAEVTGLDSDRAMVAQAQANYPHLTFQVADAADFQLPQPVDAIFSNAVLHWVTQANDAARCMAQALKPGGRLVCELGGKGNMQTVLSALAKVSRSSQANKRDLSVIHPWYFPSVSEYTTLLEQSGLTVVYANLFDRPTPLGSEGLAGWLTMFSQRFFPHLSQTAWFDMVKAVEAEAAHLYQHGEWVADYRRLRVVAIK